MNSISRAFSVVAAAAAFALSLSTGISAARAGVVVVRPPVNAQVVSPDRKGGCPGHGGVNIDPCVVTFTASNPGPVIVTVKTPNGSGSLALADNDCINKGIATIANQGNGQFLVTAGPNMGSCFGHFRYYNQQTKKIGHAALTITNTL